MEELQQAFLESISNRFINKSEAFARIDSIGYLLLENGLNMGRVKQQVTMLAEVARTYQGNEQTQVLVFLEKRINEALQEPHSFLSRYISGKIAVDPCTKLVDRHNTHRKEHKRLLAVKGLDNVAEDVFSGFKTTDLTKQPAHYRKGGDKTGS